MNVGFAGPFLSQPASKLVIPAKAGIHLASLFAMTLWIPAFAGMTGWPTATNWLLERRYENFRPLQKSNASV